MAKHSKMLLMDQLDYTSWIECCPVILSKPSRMAAFHHLPRVFGGGLFPRPWIPMIILDIGIQSMLDVVG
jgi:hypothetical protein